LTARHEPVMLREVLELFRIEPGCTYVDATVGLGGHSAAMLAEGARLVGVDRDPEALAHAAARLEGYAERLVLIHGSFTDLPDLLASIGIGPVHGVLMDLGVSSLQLEKPERGFSFRQDGPLDMRMDPNGPVTAAELVNGLPEPDLARILHAYGGEPRARSIARAIVRARDRAPISSTSELAAVITRVASRGGRRSIHPATRSFQALRIAVNDELDTLEQGIAGALEVLAPGGRLVVIAFHSLEDRIVKRAFLHEASEGRLEILTRKPLRPAREEVVVNPRARSAKLRAAQVSHVGPR